MIQTPSLQTAIVCAAPQATERTCSLKSTKRPINYKQFIEYSCEKLQSKLDKRPEILRQTKSFVTDPLHSNISASNLLWLYILVASLILGSVVYDLRRYIVAKDLYILKFVCS